MAIVLQTNRIAPILTPFNLKLGDSRLEKIAQAQTKEEACRMGWIDSTRDWFYSGAKKRCLETIYESMNSQDISTFDTEKFQKFRDALVPLSTQTGQFEKLGDASIASAKEWQTELLLKGKFARLGRQLTVILKRSDKPDSAQKLDEKSLEWAGSYARSLALLDPNQVGLFDLPRYQFELQTFLSGCTDDQKKIFVDRLLSDEDLQITIASGNPRAAQVIKGLLFSSGSTILKEAILVAGDRIKAAFEVKDLTELSFFAPIIVDLDKTIRGQIGNLVLGESGDLAPLLESALQSNHQILRLFLALSPEPRLFQTVKVLFGCSEDSHLSKRNLKWFAVKWTHWARQFFREFKLHPFSSLQLVGAAPFSSIVLHLNSNHVDFSTAPLAAP